MNESTTQQTERGRIHLIGIMHEPIFIPLLTKALDTESPTHITLEYEPSLEAILDELRAKEPQRLGWLTVGAIKPEVPITIEYGRKHNIPITYVEEGTRYDSMRNEANRFGSAPMKFDADQIQRQYTLVSSWYQNNYCPPELNISAREEAKLDREVARKILSIAANTARLVHIGGAGHLLNQSEGITLYEQLKTASPTRKALLEYQE